MIFNICIFLIVQLLASGNTVNNNEEDIDSIINLLLNGDDIEIETDQPDVDVEGDQPTFSDGIWKCGHCDVIDENKLIYTEVNDVETNYINDDRPIVVQVGLDMDMHCVTVVSENSIAASGISVRKESGACAGDAVTLTVYNATHFTVNVYGP